MHDPARVPPPPRAVTLSIAHAAECIARIAWREGGSVSVDRSSDEQSGYPVC